MKFNKQRQSPGMGFPVCWRKLYRSSIFQEILSEPILSFEFWALKKSTVPHEKLSKIERPCCRNSVGRFSRCLSPSDFLFHRLFREKCRSATYFAKSQRHDKYHF
jgi:hypothetical protein